MCRGVRLCVCVSELDQNHRHSRSTSHFTTLMVSPHHIIVSRLESRSTAANVSSRGCARQKNEKQYTWKSTVTAKKGWFFKCFAAHSELRRSKQRREGLTLGFFSLCVSNMGAAFKQASGPVADSGENTFHTQTEGGLCCGCTPPCTSQVAVHTTREWQRQNGWRRHQWIEPWRGSSRGRPSLKTPTWLVRTWPDQSDSFESYPLPCFFAPPFISKHPYIHTAIHHHVPLAEEALFSWLFAW